MNKLVIIIALLLSHLTVYAQNINIVEATEGINKKIRNYIKNGNEEYKSGRYQDAYDLYQQALAIDASSEIAKYNEAVTRLKIANTESNDTIKSELITKSIEIFDDLSKNANEPLISSISYYNLGNIAFEYQKLDEAIECYKNALRKNPNDDCARLNLRYAQLQKEKNKDNKNKQPKEDKQQKEEKQQKEQKSEQNKQQQNNEQKQDKKQDIDSKKAEQILKSMENEEQATRRKIEARKKKEEHSSGHVITDKPW